MLTRNGPNEMQQHAIDVLSSLLDECVFDTVMDIKREIRKKVIDEKGLDFNTIDAETASSMCERRSRGVGLTYQTVCPSCLNSVSVRRFSLHLSKCIQAATERERKQSMVFSSPGDLAFVSDFVQRKKPVQRSKRKLPNPKKAIEPRKNARKVTFVIDGDPFPLDPIIPPLASEVASDPLVPSQIIEPPPILQVQAIPKQRRSRGRSSMATRAMQQEDLPTVAQQQPLIQLPTAPIAYPSIRPISVGTSSSSTATWGQFPPATMQYWRMHQEMLKDSQGQQMSLFVPFQNASFWQTQPNNAESNIDDDSKKG